MTAKKLPSIAALDYAAYSAEASDRVKHEILLVDRGIQGLMITNGGALVALFTLLGSKAQFHVIPTYLWSAFASFAFGIALAMLANLAAFLSQGFYYQASQFQAWDAQRAMHGQAATRIGQTKAIFKSGQSAECGGIAAAIVALLSFIIGCGFALIGVLPA